MQGARRAGTGMYKVHEDSEHRATLQMTTAVVFQQSAGPRLFAPSYLV